MSIVSHPGATISTGAVRDARIPSISADPNYAGDIRRMAEWLVNHLHGLGLKNARLMETAGHPVAYAEWLGAGADKPTVLVYGHYDVVGKSRLPWKPTLSTAFCSSDQA